MTIPGGWLGRNIKTILGWDFENGWWKWVLYYEIIFFDWKWMRKGRELFLRAFHSCKKCWKKLMLFWGMSILRNKYKIFLLTTSLKKHVDMKNWENSQKWILVRSMVPVSLKKLGWKWPKMSLMSLVTMGKSEVKGNFIDSKDKLPLVTLEIPVKSRPFLPGFALFEGISFR